MKKYLLLIVLGIILTASCCESKPKKPVRYTYDLGEIVVLKITGKHCIIFHQNANKDSYTLKCADDNGSVYKEYDVNSYELTPLDGEVVTKETYSGAW